MAAKLTGVFEASLQDKIINSKILVVGAGGIGCEVLKNLVMSGFPDIEIIDLDTIDVSNLNRQFLFHKEHVGKSKAAVARDSALSFNPDVKIKAFHESILNTNYGVNFFKRFNVVLNALDNRQARNHVNRMCLTADVPLIESGTAGYHGQVELIKKGMTQCYECTPKAAQKSYPGCTIRNTPSEPIHCIVWAKHLFNQFFGEYNADEDVSPDTADPESTAAAGAEALTSGANTEGNIERVSTRKWAQNIEYDPEKVFNKLFNDDIKYLLSMANLWQVRKAPTPIKWGAFGVAAVNEDATASRDQKLWSLEECAEVLKDSIIAIKADFAKLADGDHLVWDKDDKNAMDFVAACSNIRSYVFGIERKSRFDIKSMAGNIIPAIATTNAITAGIVVMHAFKVLQEQYEQCRSVYVRLILNARNQLFAPESALVGRNPICIVCSPKPEIVLKMDCSKVTVKSLRDDILIKALHMVTPDVSVAGKGTILISADEDETEVNNDKFLSDLNVVEGCILKVDDFFQDYELTITIAHKDVTREDSALFEVIADPSVLKPKKSADDNDQKTENASETANGTTKSAAPADGPSPPKITKTQEIQENDDDLEVIEEVEDVQMTAGSSSSTSVIKSPPKKRKTGSDEEPAAKRSKTVDSDDDLILIEDN